MYRIFLSNLGSYVTSRDLPAHLLDLRRVVPGADGLRLTAMRDRAVRHLFDLQTTAREVGTCRTPGSAQSWSATRVGRLARSRRAATGLGIPPILVITTLTLSITEESRRCKGRAKRLSLSPKDEHHHQFVRFAAAPSSRSSEPHPFDPFRNARLRSIILLQ